MIQIAQIVPANGFRAVFETAEDGRHQNTAINDLPAGVQKNLRVVRLACFALLHDPRSHSREVGKRAVGRFIHPIPGNVDGCEQADGIPSHTGRAPGCLPAEGGQDLMDIYRWITAAKIDRQDADGAAWKQSLTEGLQQ